ncbi:MAG: ATP-binding protein [Gemmatimonadaceae bacterium]|nr:ATP-binding protein [Gemmatimonadaceae bacterium]
MAEPRVALDIEIPSDVKYIEGAVALATEQCRELDLPPQKCSLNIPVALSEALSNAILRGNSEDPKRIVRLRAMISDKALVFEIVDEGAGFDLANFKHDPTTAENLGREDGRGLFLMRKLMDRVERISENGRANVIRMTVNR